MEMMPFQQRSSKLRDHRIWNQILKRPSFFISAWNDHVALYPLPKDKEIQKKLKNFTKGKSTVWISLKEDFREQMLIELIGEV